MLEVAWEAFEDAGYRPGQETGPVSVMVGTGGNVTNYLANVLNNHPDARGPTASLLHIGNDKDFASTRVSYKLDLTGPSLNIQTACSTSLIAVHLACQSILNGECKMALAGGANIRVPEKAGYPVVKGGLYSPDGHIRTFDADARGTVFGSGVGAVLLKDLQSALDDGDHIYAVIKGSAINNDGGVKASFSGSSANGQAGAMIAAMTAAGVEPDTIGYVECHGTGTAVGDPLEIDALTRAFRTRTDRRNFCAAGSVKPNIGHPEQAAGVAAMIKAVLAIQSGQIPPTINIRTVNPKIDFESSPFFINTEMLNWPITDGPRRALCNSLGIGGTNGVVILEQAPSRIRPVTESERPVHAFTLSAKSKPALDALIARYRDWLDDAPDVPLSDICYTLAVGRTPFAFRFAAGVASLDEVRRKLAAPHTAARPDPNRRIGFLFSGQGAQFPRMARDLYQTQPVFRAALDRCAEAMRPHLNPPLLDILFADDERALRINRTGYTQPALFAVQVALTELLATWGIRPDAVVGHSVGEFAAAYLIGVYTLDDAARLVCTRGRLMESLPEGGAMAAILADEATVRAALAAADLPGIGIAAVNGPQATVISGAAAAVAEVGELLKAKGGTVTALKVSHAFHSPLMQPIMDEFRHGAASIPAAAPGILWVSTLTGQAMTAAPDADYWCDHALQAVRFADGVRTLAANGITDFIEIGPGKALLTLAQTSVQGAGLSWTATLGRDGDAWRELLETVGTLYRRGQAIDWAGFDAPYPRQRLALPTYPFQRDSFWADSSDTTAPVRAKPPAPSTGLLGPRIRSPLADLQFDMPYSRTQYSWIDDHLVYGLTVLPTTAGLVALLEAAQSHFGDPDLAITDLSYLDALVIGAKEERTVQVILTPLDDTRLDFRLVSCGTETDAPWRTHMTGSIRRSTPSSVSAFDFEHAKRTYARTLEAPAFYAGLKGIGLAYGPTFRGVRTLWRNDNECIAHVRLPDAVADISTDRLHPALLDACLHVYPAIIEAYGLLERTEIPPEGTYLPVGIERFSLIPGTAREVWVHCRRRPLGGDSGITVDIDVYCTKGRRLAGFEGLSLKPLPPALFSSAAPQVKPADDWLYQVRWDERPVAIPATDAPTSWLILADRGNTGAALADELRAKGHEVRILERKQISDNEKLLIPTLTALAKKSQDKTCGLVYLWGLDAAGPAIDPADEAQQRLIFGNALLLAQAIAETQTRFTVPPRLWLVTRNAVPATGSEPPLSILQAGLWGFGRSLALEQPRTKGGLIDLEGSPADAAALAAELLSGDGEDQVALRGGRRLAARFVRAPLPSVVSKPAGDGTWLVTGGLGALGVVTARWLIERRGVRNLVLVSRRGAADPAAKSIKAELEALGAKIKVAKADTGNEDDVKKLLLSLRKSLKGIYHSAGILDDATVPQMDWARFRRAVVPKIDAGWFLHRHSEGINLEEFVLYSSILSLTGSAGQVNYTAGNASLDALATHRRRLGLPALSLNWGPWAESGLAAQLGDRGEAIWRARGLIFLPPEIGTQALDALSTSGLDHAAILLADWPAVLRQFTTPPPFYAEFQTANDSESADSDAGDDLETLRDRLASSAPGERRGAIIAFVSRQVAGTLGMVGEVDPSQPLRELGLDSLMAITLINRIDAALGIRIPAVKLLQGPSIDQLVDDIWPDLKGIAATTGKTGAPAPAAPLRRLSEEIRVAPPSSFAPAFAPETPSAAKSNGSDKNNGTHTLTYSPWLVPIGKRVNPRLRLFCFPFVGGGSAVFRDWGNMIDPSIEVVAIEPPGRLARITEQPVSNMDEFVESVVEAMLPALDRPFALFGHCLGGLTMFEVARTLIEETSHRPNHLFCSGARSPDRVHEIGRFEKRLGRHLIKMKGFRTDLPPYQQPDRVFAEMLRHFDMAATDQFLDDPELRKLMMPAVRAEFEMTNTYHFEWDEPWDIPITCFVSKGDPYVSREDILGWGRFTNNRLQVYMRKGTHYSVFEDAKFINEIINREAFTSTE